MSTRWDALSPDKRHEVLDFTQRVLRSKVAELLDAARNSPSELKDREAIITLAEQLAHLLAES